MNAQFPAVDQRQSGGLTVGPQSSGVLDVNVLKWSDGARIGDRIVYHVGATCSLPPMDRLQALEASRLGLVFLSQKRLSEDLFQYTAARIGVHTAGLLGLTTVSRVTSLSEGFALNRRAA